MNKLNLFVFINPFASVASFAQNTFPASGKVGIGTTGPNALFTIQNNTTKSDNELHGLAELKTSEAYAIYLLSWSLM